MTLKTYLSSTVEAAVALASRELGPDAMLMSSRPSHADMQHLGRYEVVFAARKLSFHALLEDKCISPHLIEGIADASQMEAMLLHAPPLGDTVALIGPPGRGKTSTLLKLAVRHGLALRRPVRILSADGRRFGSFAATMGLDYQHFESIADLDRALATPPSDALTLVDGSRQENERELARCLNANNVDTHLVLRAEASLSGLLRMTTRYRPFGRASLIFTGLDEVDSFGHLYSAAVEARQPVSHLSAGQRVPEDLEPATPARLVSLVLQ